MDEKREKIRKYIESSNIPDELKEKELAIVDDMSLLTPEVEIALAKLIGEEFDKQIANAGITNIPSDNGVEEARKAFESDSAETEKDLESDMKIVDDNLKAIQETSDEIQKVSLQSSLNADN